MKFELPWQIAERKIREAKEKKENEKKEKNRREREAQQAAQAAAAAAAAKAAQDLQDAADAAEKERQRLEGERSAAAAAAAAAAKAAQDAADAAERERLRIERESNVDWLTTQIEILTKQITKETNTLEGETTNKGTKDSSLTASNLELRKLMLLLEDENKKGSASEQGDFELNELTKKIVECNKKINEQTNSYNTSINIIQSSTNNLKKLADQYDSLFKDNSSEAKLILNQEQIAQLNDNIAKLKTDLDSLSKSIDSDTISVDELNKNITTLIETIRQLNLIDYSKNVYNSKNILKQKEKVDIHLNSFFSYLKTKNINPELTYGKIKYREIEHQKLNNFNKLLDVLFYCFYFVFILIMIFTGNIKREHFLFYIFIGLIPILFPIVIKITKNINFGFNIFNGEKNAFIENDTEYVNAFNI